MSEAPRRAGEAARGLLSRLAPDDALLHEFRSHSRTGRSLRSEGFIAHLERQTGRLLRPRKPCPKPRS